MITIVLYQRIDSLQNQENFSQIHDLALAIFHIVQRKNLLYVAELQKKVKLFSFQDANRKFYRHPNVVGGRKSLSSFPIRPT